MVKSYKEHVMVGEKSVIIEYNAGARAYFFIMAGFSCRFGDKNGERVVKLLKALAT